MIHFLAESGHQKVNTLLSQTMSSHNTLQQLSIYSMPSWFKGAQSVPETPHQQQQQTQLYCHHQLDYLYKAGWIHMFMLCTSNSNLSIGMLLQKSRHIFSVFCFQNSVRGCELWSLFFDFCCPLQGSTHFVFLDDFLMVQLY